MNLQIIRTLKNKTYKYMTSVSKNVNIDKLDDIVHKYNNTYHKTIKAKTIDVKSSIYIYSSKEINNKDPIFNTGDIVRMSKKKFFFAKGYVLNCSEEVFVIKKIKKTLISDLKDEEIVESFYKKYAKKQIKKSLELKR